MRRTADSTETAPRFVPTEQEKKEIEQNATQAGIPTSVSLLALRLGNGLTPKTLFDAVTKLKAADTPDKMKLASEELKAMLGPGALKAFEKDGKPDLDSLLEALTVKADENAESSASKQAIALRLALAAEGEKTDQGAAPGGGAASAISPSAAENPSTPGGENATFDPSAVGAVNVDPNAQLGGTFDPSQVGRANINPFQDAQNDIDRNRLNDDLLRRRLNRRLGNNLVNPNNGINPFNGLGNAFGNNQQPFLPQITPPGLGQGPQFQPPPGNQMPLPQIPGPTQFASLTPPPVIPEPTLNPDLVRMLSGVDVDAFSTRGLDARANDIINAINVDNSLVLRTILEIGQRYNAAATNYAPFLSIQRPGMAPPPPPLGQQFSSWGGPGAGDEAANPPQIPGERSWRSK